MSSHPYGLRGDPFASPATLSAKDASRLIRRRVRAFNGDGGTLFPIASCDLIHELAGGIPDAMLELAGQAMSIAAAAGAPAVSPAHVRQAAGNAVDAVTAEAPRGSRASAVATDRPDAGASVDAEADAEADDEIQTRAEIPTRAQIAARAQAALQWEEEPAIADDDPELPAFHPAPFALPSEPSEALDPDSRDWVSRFIVPAPGAGLHTGEASRVARAQSVPDRKAGSAPKRRAVPAPSLEPAPSTAAAGTAPPIAYSRSSPGRRGRPRAHRRRRHSGGQGLLIAIAAVCVIAFVVRMSLRGNLVPPTSDNASPLPTSAPAIGQRPSVPEPPPVVSTPPVVSAPAELEPAPAVVLTPAAPVELDPPTIGRTTAPKFATPQPVAAPAPGTALVPPAPVRREPPAGKFGLEVATFIFEERARVERDRLAANGLRARLVTTIEYGSRVYRVVVGGYPHPAAAERAADSLLSNGAVLQARVVRVP
jgi:hypothetical protein